jgi:hypothetical protein
MRESLTYLTRLSGKGFPILIRLSVKFFRLAESGGYRPLNQVGYIETMQVRPNVFKMSFLRWFAGLAE